MPLTILLDLDDTLLDIQQATFLPAYYDLLASDLSEMGTPEQVLGALRAGVEPMMASHDPTRPLQQVFEQYFYPFLGCDANEMRERVLRFYREVYPSLRKRTHRKPAARELVEWAHSAGYRLALATEPVFPMAATLVRVRWAGLDPGRFELISTFETFHFPKSQPAYYAEMLGRMGWPEGPVLMAGNDVERDLVPARLLGLATFHVADHGNGAGEPSGDLGQLQKWIAAHADAIPSPDLNSREAILSVMESTPAALQGMTLGLSDAAWRAEPAAEEWTAIQVACHLRDTEREVHALQIRTLIESPDPFVARPDAAYWAKQRRYESEDGPKAVADFARARIANLETLKAVPESVWSRAARHAIFGPSSFKEVVGFMAEHDRLHLEQVLRTLRAVAGAAYRN